MECLGLQLRYSTPSASFKKSKFKRQRGVLRKGEGVAGIDSVAGISVEGFGFWVLGFEL